MAGVGKLEKHWISFPTTLLGSRQLSTSLIVLFLLDGLQTGEQDRGRGNNVRMCTQNVSYSLKLFLVFEGATQKL